jgi:RNA polymerase sigma-70 factor (ECF subfamily)
MKQNATVSQELAEPSDWLDLYGDRLFQYALSRVRDDSVAEDLVQDTLLAAMKSASSFEGRSSAYTWLVSILKNKIIDHHRKVARLREDSITDKEINSADLGFNSLGIWSSYVANWARSPEKTLENQQFLTAVQHCFSALPAKHREIFQLKFIDDTSSDEICKLMDITPSNLWVLMHRARMTLRQCVEKNWYRNESK